MKRYKNRTCDFDIGEFKNYPSHNPAPNKRPVFKEPCKCFSDEIYTEDKIIKSLISDDLLDRNISLFSSVIEWLKLRKCELDSLICHLGQLEVIKNTNRGKILFIGDTNGLNLKSLMLCLQKINLIPVLIDEKERLEDFSSECYVLTLNNLMEAFTNQLQDDIHNNNKEYYIVQYKLNWIEERKARIDFGYPIHLTTFSRKSPEPVFDLWKHLFYSRQFLCKASLEDCLCFIKKYPSLFTEDITESLQLLRDTLWQQGGDLSFTWNLGACLDNTWQSIDPTTHIFQTDLSIFYHLESLLSVAILRLIPGPARMYSGSKNVALRRSDILDRAEKLAKLLGTQGRNLYPCESLSTALYTGLSGLQSRDILIAQQKTSSQDQGVRKAQNLARDLYSDDEDQEDFIDETKFLVNLTPKSITVLETFADMIRKEIIGLHFCLINMPFLPIRTTDFIPLIQEASENQEFVVVTLTENDVSTSISSLIMTGILEKEFQRGETWIQAREDCCSEDYVEDVLRSLDPYHALVEYCSSQLN